MRLLLDTNALLWWLDDRDALGPQGRELIASPTNTVHVSSLTAAEMAIKSSLGKLRAPEDLDDQLVAYAFMPLPLSVRHALQVRYLPPLHRDPFDRLLIAQAQQEGLTILTGDKRISDYDVPVIDARL